MSTLFNSKTIKVIGFIAMVLGAGATLVSGWADGKRMEMEVAEQVTKALSNHD